MYQICQVDLRGRQRPDSERLGSQGGLSEPDAKWLYQTLKGVGEASLERLTPGIPRRQRGCSIC